MKVKFGDDCRGFETGNGVIQNAGKVGKAFEGRVADGVEGLTKRDATKTNVLGDKLKKERILPLSHHRDVQIS